MPAATKSATATKRTPRKVIGEKAEPVFVEPDHDLVADAFTVDGLRIIESHRPQNLPNAPFNYVKLTLEDNSVRYQCIDCPEFISGREEVRNHRKIFHPILKDPTKLSPAILQMTMGQLLSAAESSLSVGALVERIEGERDRYKVDLAELTRKYTQLTRALDRAGFMPKLEDE